MDSLVHAVCPSCLAQGDVPNKFVGHNIRCRKCGTSFTVAAPKPAPSLDDLDALEDIHLLPQSDEELAHESRVQAKLLGQMKNG